MTSAMTAVKPADRPKQKSNLRSCLGRGLLWMALAVLALGAVGAVYQAIATRIDRRTFTPPGQMVDIGGRRIHMLVMGDESSQPTVILEAGMASFSSNFYWVQTKLAATTRVVSYDRAGLGWSDPSPEPQDAYQSAQDLHTALVNAGISGPYVIAGHSYGGLVVRAFTDLYPGEVVGMVLIDASHPDQWAHIPISRDGKFNGRANIFTGYLACLGIVRFFHLESSIYEGLPERPAAEMQAILALPKSWQDSGEVLLLWNDRTRPRINQAKDLGDLPLAVLSVTDQPVYGEILTSLQNELADLSRNSFHVTQAGVTHEALIASQASAQVVANTIRQVIAAAQTGKPLSEIAAQSK